jgi:cell division protein FtsL
MMNLKSIALLVPLVVAAKACFDKSTYYEIDNDIEKIASSITDKDELVHFYGGIVRLV